MLIFSIENCGWDVDYPSFLSVLVCKPIAILNLCSLRCTAIYWIFRYIRFMEEGSMQLILSLNLLNILV